MDLSDLLIQCYGPDARSEVAEFMPMIKTTSITKLCTRSNLHDPRLLNLFDYIANPKNHKFRNGFVYYFLYKDKPRIVMCLQSTGSDYSSRMVNTKEGRHYNKSYVKRDAFYGFEIKPLSDFFPRLLSYRTPICCPLRSYLPLILCKDVNLQKSPGLRYSDFHEAVGNLKTRLYKIEHVRDLMILSHQLAVLV